jgi:hypothetical protein
MSQRILLIAVVTLAGTALLAAPVEAGEPHTFSLKLVEGHIWEQDFARTLRLSMWDSPLGRLEYHMAAESRTLGTGGLPHAGPSVPPFRLKLQSGVPAQIVFDYGWFETRENLPTKKKVQVIAKGVVTAGAIWTLANALK